MRPDSGEYPPFYETYVRHVQERDIRAVLEEQATAVPTRLRELDEALGDYRYATGKWSIKEVVGHLTDGERIFAYRALRFARGDETPLPGFDQNPYVDRAGFDRYPLADLIDGFEATRQANCWMVRGFDEAALARSGIASQGHVTVRALLYIMAGHVRHHMEILETRYLERQTG